MITGYCGEDSRPRRLPSKTTPHKYTTTTTQQSVCIQKKKSLNDFD